MKPKQKLQDLIRADRPLVLKNKTCVYCGKEFYNDSTREHVIGKNFVPSHKWGSDWNLITRACMGCNFHKSKLENDISAITLHFHKLEPEDQKLAEIVERKSKGSRSERTGKSVGLSSEHSTINLSHPSGLNFKFNLVAPPQIDDSRGFELARLQVTAFFYLITYDVDTNVGRFWPGSFSPVSINRKDDWGNPLQVSFMKETHSWDYRWFGITADGFFKSVIRKHPTRDCWAWALEWNLSHRVIGFCGDREVAVDIFSKFLKPKIEIIEEGGKKVTLKSDMKLDDSEDVLFNFSERG